MPRPPVGTVPWQHLDSGVARALGSRLDDVVRDVAAGVVAAVPAFAEIDDPRFREDVLETTRVTVARFAELIGTEQPALTADVREVYVSLGAAEAREEREIEVLTAALRMSARLLLRAAIDTLALDRAVTAEQVLLIAEATSMFVDGLVAACAEGYTQQVREAAGEDGRRRQRLAELLLRGGASPAAVQQHAAAVGWTNWTHLDSLVPILLPPAEAREARFRFGADGIVIERAEHVLALVRPTARLRRDLLGPRLRARGAVVGTATPWSELPGTVRLAELTAGRTEGWGAVVHVEDHLVPLALRGEPNAMAAIARHRLAAFDDLPSAQRRQLLLTLRSWLRHWGARGPVADELFVHPQTVSYRIRSVRALVGADLDDPARRIELLLALIEVLDTSAATQPSKTP